MARTPSRSAFEQSGRRVATPSRRHGGQRQDGRREPGVHYHRLLCTGAGRKPPRLAALKLPRDARRFFAPRQTAGEPHRRSAGGRLLADLRGDTFHHRVSQVRPRLSEPAKACRRISPSTATGCSSPWSCGCASTMRPIRRTGPRARNGAPDRTDCRRADSPTGAGSRRARKSASATATARRCSAASPCAAASLAPQARPQPSFSRRSASALSLCARRRTFRGSPDRWADRGR